MELRLRILRNSRGEEICQPLSGESLAYSTAISEDFARRDVKARGFWQQCAFFDMRVFN